MNVVLKQLRVFVAVSQQGSVTAAAAQLHLTKSAVSMALAELEKQLGQPLFDRVNNRLRLNVEGKRLLPLADELLQRSLGIESLFKEAGGLHGQLNIGASETVGNQICPWLIAGFRQQSQHQQQQLLIANTQVISDKILDYQLDIGLIEGSVNDPMITSVPWLMDEMSIVCPPEHPLSQQATVTIADLCGSDWLLREKGSGSREFFIRELAPQLPEWSMAFELNSSEALLNCTAAGLGLACVSKRSAEHAVADHRIVILPIEKTLQRQCQILIHKEKYQSPLLQAFVSYCQQWQG